MDTSFLEIPAICQAARAVIGHRFHWQLPAMNYSPLDPSSLLKESDWQADAKAPSASKQMAMFLSAGDIAASMHLSRQLRRQERAGDPSLDQAVWLAISGFPRDHARMAEFLDTFLEDTRAELKRRWRDVETLASAFLKRGRISAEEVAQILAQNTTGPY